VHLLSTGSIVADACPTRIRHLIVWLILAALPYPHHAGRPIVLCIPNAAALDGRRLQLIDQQCLLLLLILQSNFLIDDMHFKIWCIVYDDCGDLFLFLTR